MLQAPLLVMVLTSYLPINGLVQMKTANDQLVQPRSPSLTGKLVRLTHSMHRVN